MRRVRQIVPDALDEAELKRRTKAKMILQRWDEVVGSEMAARSWPDGFSDGTVWVAVRGSAWASELRLTRERILGRLNGLAHEPDLFKAIRFGQRPLPDRPEATAQAAEPDDTKLGRDTPLTIQEIAARRLAKRQDERAT